MEISQRRSGVVSVGIMLFALVTAGIHFYLGVQSEMVLVMFILNAFGYVGLLAAMYLNLPFFRQRRRLVRYAFIGYTLLTILLWVIMGERTLLGYITKTAEVLLVALLFMERP